MSTASHELKLKALEKKVCEFNEKGSDNSKPDGNIVRRKLHAEVELLRLDASDTALEAKMDSLVSQLNLVPLKRKSSLLSKLDDLFRFCGIVSCFLTFSSLLAIPMLLLRPLDEFLLQKKIIRANKMFSEQIKRFIGKVLLQAYGMSYLVEGRDIKFFEENSVLLIFSHASNSDAFLLASTTPVRNVALTKKELFCIPFFSWVAFACGGIPVDRKNRDKAISALNNSTNAVQNGHVCLSVAPEGTRSVTGQLQPFKKGAFYIWEELKCPIVPVVTYGAFDLYPRGSIISNTGHVRQRYLKPIMPDEAGSKDEMSALVRRRMLEAIKDCPEDVGLELTWAEKLLSVFTVLALFFIDLKLYQFIYQFAFQYLELTTKQFWIIFTVVSTSITLGLYFYYTEVVHWGTGNSKQRSSGDKKKNA